MGAEPVAKRYAGPVCNEPEARIKSRAVTERKYAKLLLIIIKQLVDLNFDRSYMTKSLNTLRIPRGVRTYTS